MKLATLTRNLLPVHRGGWTLSKASQANKELQDERHPREMIRVVCMAFEMLN